MVITPLNNKILLEPINVDKSWSEDLKNRTGLLSSSAEYIGVPREGIVTHSDLDHAKVGAHVVFDEPKPRGFWLNGTRYLPVKAKSLRGIIE